MKKIVFICFSLIFPNISFAADAWGQLSTIGYNNVVTDPDAACATQAGTLGAKDALTYFYQVVFDDYEISMTASELLALGYSLTPVNECLVKVIGSDYSGFMMCNKQAKEQSGLIAGLGKDMTSAAKTN